MSVPHCPFTPQNHNETRDFDCLFTSVRVPHAWKAPSKHLSAVCIRSSVYVCIRSNQPWRLR